MGFLRILRNLLSRVPVFGNAVILDRAGYLCDRIISLSAQLFAFLSALSILSLEEIAPSNIEHIYSTALYMLRVLLLGAFTLGWSTKMVLKVIDKYSGGGWIPLSKEIRAEELEDYYFLYEKIFSGHYLTPIQVVRRQMEGDSTAVYIVFKERMTGSREIVPCGFFVIYFLSEEGVKNLKSGRIDGRYFDTADLTDNPRNTEGIYIGAMGGISRLDKGFVMSELLILSRQFPRVPLYGRPATPEGKRIAKKYGWKPLQDAKGEESEIWIGARPYDVPHSRFYRHEN